MAVFRVLVKQNANILHSSPFTFTLDARNAAHAAACGLSRVRGDYADLIEVEALQPAPGRPEVTLFHVCSQGVYGFHYTSRSYAAKQGGATVCVS